jgi:putative FmdB family regulatory protein
MPTYDYTCATCHQLVTIVARIDQTITPPICGACAAVMKRKFWPIAAQFKGDGWGKD